MSLEKESNRCVKFVLVFFPILSRAWHLFQIFLIASIILSLGWLQGTNEWKRDKGFAFDASRNIQLTLPERINSFIFNPPRSFGFDNQLLFWHSTDLDADCIFCLFTNFRRRPSWPVFSTLWNLIALDLKVFFSPQRPCI